MSEQHARPVAEPPKLVLFDLDDTLCDHDTSLRIRLEIAFREVLDDRSDILVEDVVQTAVERAFAGTDHFAEVFALFGAPEPWRVERAVQSYVSDRYRGLQLFDEAIEVVETIKRQARVGMITNGPSQIQRDKIARLEIADLFPFILVSEEEGVWKPDPAIFERALRLGEAQPHEALYVGDSPEHDIAGAQAAGVTAVWINRRGRTWESGPPPEFEIRNLRELLSLFGFEGSHGQQ